MQYFPLKSCSLFNIVYNVFTVNTECEDEAHQSERWARERTADSPNINQMKSSQMDSCPSQSEALVSASLKPRVLPITKCSYRNIKYIVLLASRFVLYYTSQSPGGRGSWSQYLCVPVYKYIYFSFLHLAIVLYCVF